MSGWLSRLFPRRPKVDPEQARDMLGQSAILLDVREDAGWRTGHAPKARRIPLSRLPARLRDLPLTDTLMGISRRTGPRAGSRIHRRVMDRSSGIVDSQEWDQRYADAGLVWTAQPNRFVVDELQPLPPGRAVDLGTSEGRNAIWLAGRGWQVTAVDFSAVGLDKGRRLAGAHGLAIDWVHADLRDYQPGEALSTSSLSPTCSFARRSWTACCAGPRQRSRPGVCCWSWATT